MGHRRMRRRDPSDGRRAQHLSAERVTAHGGDCNVPRTWEDDPRLGWWVTTQKAQLRKYEADPATSSLSAERVAALWLMGAIESWRSRERRSRASAREPLGQKSYVLFEV